MGAGLGLHPDAEALDAEEVFDAVDHRSGEDAGQDIAVRVGSTNALPYPTMRLSQLSPKGFTKARSKSPFVLTSGSSEGVVS